MFKKLNRAIFRTIIHENTHSKVNIQTEHLRLLRMLSILVSQKYFLVQFPQDIEQLYTLTFRKTESN